MSTLKISHVGSSKAYCHCPKHIDKRASISVDLVGEYRGRFYCWSCGWHGKLSEKELAKLMSKRKKKNRLITFDWEKLQKEYYEHLKFLDVCQPFRVTWETLEAFGIGHDDTAFTFPMRNPQGQVVGIQRQFPDRMKVCVEGSSLGLFIPEGCYGPGFKWNPKDVMFITEGCSDGCSIYDLGFHAIGRPSCNSCEDMVFEYCNLYQISRPIMVADNDKPGLIGAKNLLTNMRLEGAKDSIYIPTYKDVRMDIEKLGREEVTKRLKGFV